MIRNIKLQQKTMFEKLWPIVVLVALYVLIFINFFSNVIKYQGTDVSLMINPMRILFLSNDDLEAGKLNALFLQLYPLVVALPVFSSYFDDKHTGEIVFMASRMGKKKYFISKGIAAGLINFIVFTLPMLTEFLLNCISFPMSANGNSFMQPVYDQGYIDAAENYMMFDLFKVSPVTYAFVTILLFGILSAVLGMFVLAVSLYISRYKIILLVPVYILMYGIGMINSLFPAVKTKTSHFAYLSMFDVTYKSEWAYLLLILIIFVISWIGILIKTRKDVLE